MAGAFPKVKPAEERLISKLAEDRPDGISTRDLVLALLRDPEVRSEIARSSSSSGVDLRGSALDFLLDGRLGRDREVVALLEEIERMR